MSDFEVKACPEIWQSLGVDVERFDKARRMLGETYGKKYSSVRKTGRRAWPILTA